MSRVAAVVLALLVVAGGLSACRDERGATPPPTGGPAPSVERQLDDIESTLDGIESELNEG